MSELSKSASEQGEEEALSLWDCLHDARLIDISSSASNRSISIAFDIWHIREFHHLPEETRFVLTCVDVDLAWVSNETAWPSKEFASPEQAGKTAPSAPDWTASWEEQPVTWPEFEHLLKVNPWGEGWVYEGELESLPDGKMALRLGAELSESYWPGFYFRCSSLAIAKSSGEQLTVEEFLALGEVYWAAFAARRAAREAKECDEEEEVR